MKFPIGQVYETISNLTVSGTLTAVDIEPSSASTALDIAGTQVGGTLTIWNETSRSGNINIGQGTIAKQINIGTTSGAGSPATSQYLTIDNNTTITLSTDSYAQSQIRVPQPYIETFDGTTIQYGISGYGQSNNTGLKGGGGWLYSGTGTNGGNSYFLLYFTKTVSVTSSTPKITLTNNYIQFPDGSQQTSASSGTGSGTGGPTGPSPWITSGSDISYNAGNISTTKTLDLNVYRTDHLRPVSYLNKLNNKYSLGLIAHELQEHYSFLVDGEKDGEKNSICWLYWYNSNNDKRNTRVKNHFEKE